MNRAFVKDADDNGAIEEVPERVISEHTNFVTARGLWLIEDSIVQLEQRREVARVADDATTLAHINRDLHYWQQRLASAQLVTPEASPKKVRFGVTVDLAFADGSRCRYSIVGEDEADPADGYIAWVAPVAKVLMGREVGDEVELPDGKARITALTVRQ